MIDFHSHILPNVDDGSPSVEVSVAMLRAAAQQGVTHVVATPHFYPRYDDPRRFLERRNRGESALRQEIGRHEGLPNMLIGAEVAFFRGISDSEFLPELTIRGNECILIEMPLPPWPEEFYRELEAIWVKRSVLPVIAHVDRYIRPFRTFGIPQRLANMPVYVQANGEFFLERSTARMALRMLKAGQIHLLGSDCHNLSDRQPNLGPVMEKIRSCCSEGILDQLRKHERIVLSGICNTEDIYQEV